MQKIIPHVWYNVEAKEAAEFYTTLFPNSSVTNVTTITDTPSGDCDLVSFTLMGQEFRSISAGPYFTLNPAISLFTVFESEAAIEQVWNALADGGRVLMPFDTYPWAQKYGWIQDKYGLSWQLSLSENHQLNQTITPMLLFTKEGAGQAEAALDVYTSIFPDSKIDMVTRYGKDEGDTEGYIKHARFTLAGQGFMAMDSSIGHQFSFNESLSLMVYCDTQEEIDYYWEKLSAVPEAEQCGWLKDRFGVSWQIVPTVLQEIMESGDAPAISRVTKAFLTMKKFDIAALQKAFAGVE